jgi:hypothetical protein
MLYILFYLSVFLIFLGKGIADIVSDEPNWRKSVFSKFPIDSFWGCKDNTWVRKYRENKITNYLFSTIFVWTTDIWHFANMIGKLGTYLSVFFAILIGQSYDLNLFQSFLIVVLFTFFNILGFHLSYTYFLRKKNN